MADPTIFRWVGNGHCFEQIMAQNINFCNDVIFLTNMPLWALFRRFSCGSVSCAGLPNVFR